MLSIAQNIKTIYKILFLGDGMYSKNNNRFNTMSYTYISILTKFKKYCSYNKHGSNEKMCVTNINDTTIILPKEDLYILYFHLPHIDSTSQHEHAYVWNVRSIGWKIQSLLRSFSLCTGNTHPSTNDRITIFASLSWKHQQGILSLTKCPCS